MKEQEKKKNIYRGKTLAGRVIEGELEIIDMCRYYIWENLGFGKSMIQVNPDTIEMVDHE
ncbi:MAG: hypothetical protein HUJ53_04545 [Holdemanella sp.]|nr:hypothetical protein [Holdemanella sp.]